MDVLSGANMIRTLGRMLPAVVVLAGAALLIAAPAGNKDRKQTAAEKLREALEGPVALEVADQPLPAVIAQLADLGKAPIILDRNALNMMGADASEANVSLRVKDVPLKMALRQAAGQHGLSFAVVGDHILVSSEDVVCQRQLKQRINLDLEDVVLTKALKDLARDTATNLVLDPRVAKKANDAKVTLRLDEVPLETAVKLMADMADLKPARMGNVLFVTATDRADKLRDADPPAPNPFWPGMPGGLGGIAVGPPGALPIVPAAPAVPANPPPAPPPAPKDKDK